VEDSKNIPQQSSFDDEGVHTELGTAISNVGRDADIAQIVFVRSLVNTPSLCLTSTGIVIATIARRRCRFHLSVGVYFKEVSYFSNAVQLLAIP
jgi:hypothetical protein